MITDPKQVDPELNLVRKFPLGSTQVYQVERAGQFYVLKTSEIDCCFGSKHIAKEREALKRAERVEGITHLIGEYSPEGHIALLKEYAESWDIQEGRKPNLRVRKKLIADLERTIKELHSLGMANLDISQNNVVLAPDFSSIKIIDLGFCSFSDDPLPRGEFQRMKKGDLQILEYSAGLR